MIVQVSSWSHLRPFTPPLFLLYVHLKYHEKILINLCELALLA